MDRLSSAVRYAIEHTPGSIRALADEAGVSHATLVYIRTGKRPATVPVARAVRDACRRMREDCRKGEQVIGKALNRRGRR